MLATGRPPQLEKSVQTACAEVSSKHGSLVNPNGVTMIDDVLCIHGGYGLQTVYISMEHCFSNMQTITSYNDTSTVNTISCGHRVRYADGRLLLLSSESIKKMFISRHQRVHIHFQSDAGKIEKEAP